MKILWFQIYGFKLYQKRYMSLDKLQGSEVFIIQGDQNVFKVFNEVLYFAYHTFQKNHFSKSPFSEAEKPSFYVNTSE